MPGVGLEKVRMPGAGRGFPEPFGSYALPATCAAYLRIDIHKGKADRQKGENP
jgi:hypothetical protein